VDNEAANENETNGMRGCSRNKGTIALLAVFSCIAATVWGTPALAAGSSLPYGGGGRFAKFDPIVQQYNQSGELFRIQGHCQSSCTLFLAIRNVCIEPGATLLFHGGGFPEISAAATEHMLSAYNSSLRAHLWSTTRWRRRRFSPSREPT
jgi:hypothetical protein